jgi:hypothetical protein
MLGCRVAGAELIDFVAPAAHMHSERVISLNEGERDPAESTRIAEG